MIRDLFRWFGLVVLYVLIAIALPIWLGAVVGSSIAAALGLVLLIRAWRRRDR